MSPHLLAAFATLLAVSGSALGAPAPDASADPCAAIAGKQFVPPKDSLACLKSFPFNETLRQNILTVVSRVFDFYTFENYYLDAIPPFQDSTVNIRAELDRINNTEYATDYDFNQDLYFFTNRLNDGHTRWRPNCYTTFQNLLPAPVVTLEQDGEQSVFVAPDSVEFLGLLGPEFAAHFAALGFDWKRLAGARVLEIGGMGAYEYASFIAETQTGTYLDHGVRVNRAFSSYAVTGSNYTQRIGDIAGPVFPDLESLTMKLVPVGATEAETVEIPFLSTYLGTEPFADKEEYWEVNCAAKEGTNGIDYKDAAQAARFGPPEVRKLARADILDVLGPKSAIDLPPQFEPDLPLVPGSRGILKSYILPDGKTGVMFVASFAPSDFYQFQRDVRDVLAEFEKAGLEQLVIDLTNNGGGYVCLGQFLHAYLTGTKSLGEFQNPGFESTNRVNPLAKKILESEIALGLDVNIAYYTADNWSFLNNTQMSKSYNYMEPSITRDINGVEFTESQRFGDACPFVVDFPEEPYFAPEQIVIVGNANCASTCAMFSNLMKERHNTTIAIFGGRPGVQMEFKGMAGNQVLNWFDFDSEIKTAELKDDPLAPPDLLVNGNFRHNWRIAYSFLDKSAPIEWKSELPDYRFAYTIDTYNNPQKLWTFAAEKLFS